MIAGLLVALALAWWFARADTQVPNQPTAAATSVAGEDVPASEQGPGPGSDAAAKPLYRWTDDAGVVHFTDVPPGDRAYVEVDVDPDRNVVTFPPPVEP